MDITNTGQRAGEEVVQLYVRDLKPQIDKPVRELKGFARVVLQPGETKPVTFTVTPRDLAYFDVAGKQWKADAGDYENRSRGIVPRHSAEDQCTSGFRIHRSCAIVARSITVRSCPLTDVNCVGILSFDGNIGASPTRLGSFGSQCF